MLDGVRYGFDPVSDRFVQTTDTQYQYSDVNVIAIHHALVKSGITPQEVDVVVTLPLSEYFDTNAQPDIANINRKKANDARMLQAYRIAQAALQATSTAKKAQDSRGGSEESENANFTGYSSCCEGVYIQTSPTQ